MWQLREFKKGPNSLVVCGNMEQRWPIVNKLEMLALPWDPVEERLQMVWEIRMLERICHVRPPHLQRRAQRTCCSSIL